MEPRANYFIIKTVDGYQHVCGKLLAYSEEQAKEQLEWLNRDRKEPSWEFYTLAKEVFIGS